MKPLKLVLFLLGAGLLLAAGLVALALLPSVQTWVARRALEGSPLAVERVAAGMGAARLEGVTFRQPGLVVRVGSLETRHSLGAWLGSRRLDAEEITVRDVVVERTPAPADATAPANPPVPAVTAPGSAIPPASGKADAPPKAFAGLLDPARLPFDLRVGRLSVAGRASLGNGQTATFDLQGTNLATGGDGRLEWTLDFADATPAAALRGLRSTGTATLTLAADRALTAVGLETTLAALGPALPPDQVTLSAQANRDPQGKEAYTIRLGLLRRGQAETLLQAKGGFAPAQADLSGTWDVALRSEQLAALLAGFGLPEVAATGEGQFSVRPDGTAGATTGRLQATVSRLGQISPTLAAIGSIQVAATFDVGLQDHAAQLKAFDVDVSEAGGRRFARLQLTQPATYRLAERQLSLANPQAEAARLVLDAVPLAWAQPLVQPLQIAQGTLSLELAAVAEPDGSRIRLQSPAPVVLQNLVLREAGGRPLVEGLTISARPTVDYTREQLRASLAEFSARLPAGDAVQGELRTETRPLTGKPATTFQANLEAKVATLLRPFLAFDPGAIEAKVNLEGRHEGDALTVSRAEAGVTRAGGAPLARVALLQPVRGDLRAGTFSAENAANPALRVELGEIPLAWAGAYVPNSLLTGSLSGAALTLTWANDGAATLHTASPLGLRGVNLALGGQPQVSNLDLSLDATAVRRGQTLGFTVRRLEARQGEEALLLVEAEGELTPGPKPAGKVKGSVQAEALLFRQPALTALVPVAQGRIRTTFDTTFKVGDALAAKLSLTTKGLGVRGQPALGDAELSLTAQAKADGSATFALPLTVTAAGRKSDLTLEGSVSAAAKDQPRTFNLRATSTNLVIDDLQAFAALAPASSGTPAATVAPAAAKPTGNRPAAASSSRPQTTAPAKSPAPAAVTPDRAPPWRGLQGRLEVDLKRVLYGRDYTGRGLKGTATLTPSRFALDSLQGSFRDQPFNMGAALTFTPGQAQPYALTGQVDISGLAIGEVLRAANPGEKPLLESTVKVAAKLSGRGATVPDTLARAYGQFEVTGGPGVLRALGKKGQTVSAASTLLGVAGALAGSGNTLALSQLGRELEEMQFDRFSLKVERDAALNFRATTIEFLSPSKRLTGRGAMTYREGAPFDAWPLELEFRLAGKDFMARLLNEARVLSGEQDDQGYFPMAVPFTVNGTLAGVNNSLWKVLAGSAARAGLEGLLGR
ncbi:MAG: hypothetical protein B9S27_01110 [Opitutia bacterium Tous-C8FEB]|nr:MAG: hypothetical protein B9S27_01110 [Opitutae bacterium Tous-C8FEB]